MEAVAKFIVLAIGAAALLFGMYIGIRTAQDPVWFVLWLNRLNGDPRDYPQEFNDQCWARWHRMIRDPEVVRRSPVLFWQHRIAGILLIVISAVYLLGLIGYAARH